MGQRVFVDVDVDVVFTELIYEAPGKVRGVEAVIIILLLTLAAGCSMYERMPLDSNAVEKRLSPPSMETVRIRAKEIRHPTLKPVQIDERRGLTPYETAVVAVLVNPKLVTERDKRGVAGAQLLQAGIFPNPQLSYNMDFPVAGSTTGTVVAYGLGLSYDIRSLVTRSADIDAARANAASVDLNTAWQEWQVAEAAKSHAYRLLLLEKQLAVAQEEAAGLEENFHAVKHAVNMGNLTLIELSAAQASLEKVRLLVLTTRQSLDQERLALNRSLGFPPDRTILIRKDVELPDLSVIPPAAELSREIENRRIDLLALKAGYESQEEKLRAAVLGQFPKITIGPSLSRDNTNVYSLGFALTIDLPFFDRSQGRIAIERATRKQLFDEYIDRLFESRAKIAAIRANMESIEREIKASNEALPVLENLIKTYHVALLEGNADVLSYYKARDDFISKRLDVTGLELQLVDQLTALEIEAGLTLGQTD